MSAKTKFKLTAHEGCRVRKVALATFASVACEDYAETCLACLTNLGDVHVFSVPGLRPQVHYACIRKEDISGIASCVFTRHGQGEAQPSRGGGLRGTGRAAGACQWGGGPSGGCGTGWPRPRSRPLGAVVGAHLFTAPHSLFAHPGFYLISPSEFERFSLSARNITEPLCSLDISWPRDTTRARCMAGAAQRPVSRAGHIPRPSLPACTPL